MKAPRFDLVCDEEALTACSLLLDDTRPVKLKRRRALNCTSTLTTLGDEDARRCFDDGKDTVKGAYNRRAYLKDRALYFALFPCLFVFFLAILSVIVLTDFQSAVENTPALLVLLLICWAISAVGTPTLIIIGVSKDRYLKRAFHHLDDVYVFKGKSGALCAVCFGEYETRVLCGEKLVVYYKDGKSVAYDDPRRVYLEYLDLYPQSALDMGAFVSERKQYFLADDRGARKDVSAVFSEFSDKSLLSVNATGINVTVWKLHKILFELDKNLNLVKIYSVAGKGYSEYITLAEVEKRGDGVIAELKQKFPDLPEEIL